MRSVVVRVQVSVQLVSLVDAPNRDFGVPQAVIFVSSYQSGVVLSFEPEMTYCSIVRL